MKNERISKSEMAKLMGTRRSQLERVLEPDNPNILPETVASSALTEARRFGTGSVQNSRAGQPAPADHMALSTRWQWWCAILKRWQETNSLTRR